MSTPFPYRKESQLFGEALVKIAQYSQRQQLSQYVAQENMQNFHHGRGWLTVREDETEESELGEAGVELTIKFSSIINNDIQELFDFVSNFIEGFTSQIVNKMFKEISGVCDSSGNTIKLSEYPSRAEAFKEMLKKIEFSVNEYGKVELPRLHLNPDEAKALNDDLDAQGIEFKKEIEQIKKEKVEAAIQKEKVRLSKYKAINL